MSKWIEIGTLDDIPQRGSRIVKTDRGDIAVFRTGDDRVFAVNDRCPHKGGPLSQGIVYEHRVACPLHNWSIDLESGQAVAPDVGRVKCFEVRTEDGKVFLSLEGTP